MAILQQLSRSASGLRYDMTLMKKLILTAALLGGSLPLLLASTDPAAQQFLVTAKQQASLFHDQRRPLQLEVDFLA
jgi:hypothetical protein